MGGWSTPRRVARSSSPRRDSARAMRSKLKKFQHAVRPRPPVRPSVRLWRFAAACIVLWLPIPVLASFVEFSIRNCIPESMSAWTGINRVSQSVGHGKPTEGRREGAVAVAFHNFQVCTKTENNPPDLLSFHPPSLPPSRPRAPGSRSTVGGERPVSSVNRLTLYDINVISTRLLPSTTTSAAAAAAATAATSLPTVPSLRPSVCPSRPIKA